MPAVHNWDDSGFPLRDFHEGGFGHVKMHSWRIAPATIVGGLRPIRRAKIGGSYCGEGHIFVTCTGLVAFYLITSPTRVTIVEQGRT